MPQKCKVHTEQQGMRKHTVNSICSYREGEDALVKIHVARPSSSGLACQLTSTKANIETDLPLASKTEEQCDCSVERAQLLEVFLQG